MARMLFIILLVFVPLSSTSSDASPLNIKLWCSQTPYPNPCQYFSSTQNPKSFAKFKKIAMQISLDQALQAQTNIIMWPRTKWRNEREQAAWTDCLDLYENTILRLNFTVSYYGQHTDVDAQTWLSTALTNIETCRTSFIELGVSDDHHMLPLVSKNVSKLISNALAINKVNYKNDQFLNWLLQAPPAASQANLVVAQDGSRNFKTIQEAVDAASKREGNERLVIYVKAGIYNENVQIGNEGKNIMLIGDGIGKTIVTGSKSASGGSTTFNSATFAVIGDGFIARDITFRNTAGPSKGQAVALRSGSDLSVFYRCSFEGYQDTLYVYSDRQFYRECDIYGTIDFIFGNAIVVFQNCNIYARTTSHKINTITAQGRSDPNQNTGILIHNSKVMAISDLNNPVRNSVRTYLGRPWKEHSRTVFLKTYLDSSIDPAGWLEWNDKSAPNTLYYGEYKNTGPGSSTAERVKWGGYHVITSTSEASKFTVGNFLLGDSWLPSTNVPFNPTL